jgi:hypothetical protein
MIDGILKLASGSMSMSEEVWFRHANAWSGRTRFATYPLVILAFWSRAWRCIGNMAHGGGRSSNPTAAPPLLLH